MKFRPGLAHGSRLPLFCVSGLLLLGRAEAQEPGATGTEANPEESAPAQPEATGNSNNEAGTESDSPTNPDDSAAADAISAAEARLGEERLAFLRVQLALDAAGFGPGRLDAREGEFTSKAVVRWNQAKPDQALAQTDDDKLDAAQLPDTLWDGPVLTEITLTEADVAQVGELPEGPEAKATREKLPYAHLLELVAERFHAEEDFIIELNELGENRELEVGQTLVVPAVKEPFSLDRVNELAARRAEALESTEDEDQTDSKEDSDGETPEDSSGDDAAAGKPKVTQVRVLLGENQVEVLDGDAVIRSWPVTIGPAGNESPEGEERVVVVQWLPEFRWDQQMLDEGVRSDDAHLLPPGPNSPVGIVWIGLSADGIGLHGTADPDGIGRSDSHGCIRLSNWDALALGQLVDEGTVVELVK